MMHPESTHAGTQVGHQGCSHGAFLGARMGEHGYLMADRWASPMDPHFGRYRP